MATPAPAKRGSLGALLVLAVTIAAGFCTMQSFSIMGESAKAELHLSDAMLGAIQGVSAAVPLVLLSVPIGVLVDRVNRIRLTMALALLWSLGTFVTALAPGAGSLFLGRMMVGIGTTGALTAALSLSADLCRPEQRGRAMLLNTLGKTAGIAAGIALAGWLMGAFASGTWQPFGRLPAWRSAQGTLGIGGAVPLLLLAWCREPERHEAEAATGAPLRVIIAELWSRRAFLAPLFAGQTGVVMVDAAANIWAAPILQRGYGLAPPQFAGWLGLTLLLAGAAGAVLGGLVADRGHRSGRRGGLMIGAVAAAWVGVPAALFAVMPTVTGFGVAIGALMLSGTITGLIVSVALTVYLPNEIRGLAIGAFIALAGLVGFGIAPSLVAALGEALGGGRHIGTAQAIVGVVIGLVAVGGFRIAMRRAPVDYRQPL